MTTNTTPAGEYELCFVLTEGEAKGGGIYMGKYPTREAALAAAPRCRKELLADIQRGTYAQWRNAAEVATARVLVI